MNRLRRNLIALSSFPLLASLAMAAPSVDVVKIMSFSCSVCLASEAQDKLIYDAVVSQGGQFVWAPVPTREEDKLGAKERVYYASRDVDRRFSERVRASMYKGEQEQGLPLFDFMQVYSWITRDLAEDEKYFDVLFEKAQGNSSREALGRAARLAVNAGSQALPSYVVLRGGELVTVLDPTSVNNSNLTALRELVISRVTELNKK